MAEEILRQEQPPEPPADERSLALPGPDVLDAPHSEPGAATLDPAEVIVDDRELPGDAQHHPRKISRRTALVAGGAAVAALGFGTYLWRQWSQAQNAEKLVGNMIDEIVRGLPTDAQLLQMALECGDDELYLDEIQEQAGTTGQRLKARKYVFGTSIRFPIGLDNAPGPHHYQQHAIDQMGLDSLSQEDLKELALELVVEVFAHPGAWSGQGNYPHHKTGATDSIDGEGQVANPDFQAETRQVDELAVATMEPSFDDLRLLYDVMLELMCGVHNPRQAMSPTISRDMQRLVEAFMTAMDGIIDNTGANVLWAHHNFARIDLDRRASGFKYPFVVQNDLTWKFDDFQRYFSISPIDNEPVDPLLSDWIVPDPFGPPELNRAMLDSHALPYGFGRKLALIAWTKMMVADMNAIRTARAEHPNLRFVRNQLMYINRLKYFYAALALYGKDKGKIKLAGDGHPGQVEGMIAGAEQLAVRGLMLWKRRVNGVKRSVGEYSALYVPEDVAAINGLIAATMGAAA